MVKYSPSYHKPYRVEMQTENFKGIIRGSYNVVDANGKARTGYGYDEDARIKAEAEVDRLNKSADDPYTFPLPDKEMR